MATKKTGAKKPASPKRGGKRPVPAVVVRDLSKSYATQAEVLPVLVNVGFELARGESLAIVGESGSGKSTLLNLLGGLDYASRGSIGILGTPIEDMNETELARFRNRHVGFVFQYHHLLPDFSALENVMMPGILAGHPAEDLAPLAAELLDAVGLGDRAGHRPSQLSGGEQQRVAIVRALVNRPGLVLMDEPTGNLDEKTGRGVLALIEKLRREFGLTLVIVTHSQNVALSCDRCLRLSAGRAEMIALSEVRGRRGAVRKR